MSATDRIRDKARWAKRVYAPVSVTVSEAEALCDLADAARCHLEPGESATERCRCENEMAAALARLDGEDTP